MTNDEKSHLQGTDGLLAEATAERDRLRRALGEIRDGLDLV